MKVNFLFLITLITALFLSGCEFDKIKFGEVRMMYGTNEYGRISYDITTFTGTEKGEHLAQSGQRISFNYAVDLEKGELLIEWQDPQGDVLWQRVFEESETGDGELETHTPGTYRIYVKGEGAGGGFDISWQEK